jgi:hypothetical protein
MTADVYATVAEAIKSVIGDNPTMPGEIDECARAAVNALAGMGDVTVRRFYMDETPFGHPVQVDDPKGGFVLYADHEAAIAQARATDQARIAEQDEQLRWWQQTAECWHTSTIEAQRQRDTAIACAATDTARAEAAEATVERVRALCDTYTDAGAHYVTFGVLRAALADPKGEA